MAGDGSGTFKLWQEIAHEDQVKTLLVESAQDIKSLMASLRGEV